MTNEQPKTKKINDLEALATLVRSSDYAIPILDLGDRDADGDPKLKQVPINLLQSLFKDETNLAKVATSGKYGDLKNLPQLFSGNYADLSGKPNIPSRTSQLQNDSGFLTQHQDISGKADISDIVNLISSARGKFEMKFFEFPGVDLEHASIGTEWLSFSGDVDFSRSQYMQYIIFGFVHLYGGFEYYYLWSGHDNLPGGGPHFYFKRDHSSGNVTVPWVASPDPKPVIWLDDNKILIYNLPATAGATAYIEGFVIGVKA